MRLGEDSEGGMEEARQDKEEINTLPSYSTPLVWSIAPRITEHLCAAAERP